MQEKGATLSLELDGLRRSHLKEKLELEQRIERKTQEWQMDKSRLSECLKMDNSLRILLRKIEKANCDLLKSQDQRNHLWEQKVCIFFHTHASFILTHFYCKVYKVGL